MYSRMPQDTKTVSAKLDADSALATEFEEYREANGMTSKSEAVRHLLRAGLEQQRVDDSVDDDAQPDQPVQTSADAQQVDINLIRGNEPILFGLAFVIGSDGFLTVTQSIAGQFWGSVLFAAIGATIFASMLPMFGRALFHLVQNSGTDDADASSGGVQG
jgi:hypothetical protein